MAKTNYNTGLLGFQDLKAVPCGLLGNQIESKSKGRTNVGELPFMPHAYLTSVSRNSVLRADVFLLMVFLR